VTKPAPTFGVREERGAGSSGPSSSLEDKSDAMSFAFVSFTVICDFVIATGLQLSAKPEEGCIAVTDLSIAGNSFMGREAVGDSNFVSVDRSEAVGKTFARGPGA